jgi:phosphoglucosamine mutase
VLEALDTGGWSLGGEQSGHIVFSDLATTGDGLLAGVLLADLVRRSGRPLDELARAAMTHVPQVLLNVAIAAPMPDITEQIAEPLAAANAELGADGRVLVRPSGTEPVVRVMVEAVDADVADDVAQRLADAVRAASAD